MEGMQMGSGRARDLTVLDRSDPGRPAANGSSLEKGILFGRIIWTQ